MAHLEDWTLLGAYHRYTHPSSQLSFLRGRLSDHPLLPDGKNVYTSQVERIDVEKGTAVTRSGTQYTLGQMHKDYESWFNEHGTNQEG